MFELNCMQYFIRDPSQGNKRKSNKNYRDQIINETSIVNSVIVEQEILKIPR